MTFIKSFFVALFTLFLEIFAGLRKIGFNFNHVFSKNSKIPIIRMFHEALKSEN